MTKVKIKSLEKDRDEYNTRFNIVKQNVYSDCTEYFNQEDGDTSNTRETCETSINNLNEVINDISSLDNKTYNAITETIDEIRSQEEKLQELKEDNSILRGKLNILKGSDNAYDERMENIDYIFRRNMYIYGIFLLGTFVTSGILIKLIRE